MRALAICTVLGIVALSHWVWDTAADDSSVSTQVASDTAHVDALRAELLRLTEQAVLEMDAAELTAEVEAARRRVSDSAADEKLEQIRQQLTELVEQYPDTDAAGLASMMLNISDGTLQIEPFGLDRVEGLNFY